LLRRFAPRNDEKDYALHGDGTRLRVANKDAEGKIVIANAVKQSRRPSHSKGRKSQLFRILFFPNCSFTTFLAMTVTQARRRAIGAAAGLFFYPIFF